MKKLIFSALVISSFVLFNCSRQKTNNEQNSKSHLQLLQLPESGKDTLKASSFADTVLYIPLETNKESFISSIRQMWMSDSVILVDDFGSLLMFKHNGRFIKQIGKNGRGPGEYESILHFDVINDTIYISTTGKRSLLRYTLGGTFCDELKFNFEPDCFSSTTDHKLACFVHPEGKIYVFRNFHSSPESITVEYGVTEGRYRFVQMPSSGYYYLQKTASGLLFNSSRSDTIWNIETNKKESAYLLNLKDKLLPYDKQIEFSNGDFETFNKNANPYSFVHIIPFPSLTFVFQFHHTIYADGSGYDAISINNNKTGEITKYNTSYIFDDIVSKQKLSNERLTYFFPVYSSKYLVTSKKPLDVLKFINQNKNKTGLSPQWLNQMKGIREEDNPILVLVRLGVRS